MTALPPETPPETPPTHDRATRTAPLEVVHAKRTRCPRCLGAALRKYRSVVDQGDGSSLSWVRCLDDQCNHRFKIVLE